jgi:sulfatase maturation enzyme AslB (radical SAM superfamily)
MASLFTIKYYNQHSLAYLCSVVFRSAIVRRSVLGKLNPRRIINALRAIADWRLRRTRIGSRPFVVRFDPSAICNLKCPSCHTPKRVFAVGETKVMSLDVFERMLEQVKRKAIRLTFYMEGEPTTNPQLFAMITRSTQAKLYSSFSTNFTLMRDTWLKPLFDSGLD